MNKNPCYRGHGQNAAGIGMIVDVEKSIVYCRMRKRDRRSRFQWTYAETGIYLFKISEIIASLQ